MCAGRNFKFVRFLFFIYFFALIWDMKQYEMKKVKDGNLPKTKTEFSALNVKKKIMYIHIHVSYARSLINWKLEIGSILNVTKHVHVHTSVQCLMLHPRYFLKLKLRISLSAMKLFRSLLLRKKKREKKLSWKRKCLTGSHVYLFMHA
jgi:hypothetical protein